MVLHGSLGSGRSALRPGVLSHLAHGSPSASRARLCRRSLHLGVSRGDLGVHPRCSDTSSAFDKESRSRGPCIYLAYGRSTCAELASRVDTKVSHDDTVSWTESRWAWVLPPKLAVTAVLLVRPFQLGECLPRRCAASRGRSRRARWGRTFSDGNADEPAAGAALLCRLDPHEPQGWEESSVPTLEASSAQVERPQANKNRGRAAAFPVRNAEDVSEQRGWAPKALRRATATVPPRHPYA